MVIIAYDELLIWEYVLLRFRYHVATLLGIPEDQVRVEVEDHEGKRRLNTNILLPDDVDEKSKDTIAKVLAQMYPAAKEEILSLAAGLGDRRDDT